MSTNNGALDLTACPITSGLLRFSLPFLASSVLQTLYSTVDTIIVGQFVGSAGLAAVNNVSYICNAASNIGSSPSTVGQRTTRGSTAQWARPCPSALSWR